MNSGLHFDVHLLFLVAYCRSGGSEYEASFGTLQQLSFFFLYLLAVVVDTAVQKKRMHCDW